jgi:hypothetical protein
MFDITTIIPARHRRTQKGWWSFDCPVCHLHNTSSDKRGRGGIHLTPDDGWAYHCFNCNHRAKFVPGETLSLAAKQLLRGLGLTEEDLTFINLESIKQRGLLNYLDPAPQASVVPSMRTIEFETIDLPGKMLNTSDPAHKSYVDYLTSRCIDINQYPFLVDDKAKRDGIIIPFTHNGKVVGHTTRYFDDATPKYLSHQPDGYVFGLDYQLPDWTYLIVVEGPFCAMSINGAAVLHQVISGSQLAMLRATRKEIIVVPDQHKSGFEIIEQAIQEGLSVSIPEWHDDIKDVNDAVKMYGKIGALLTILRSREKSELKIDLRRKWLDKRVHG